MMSVRCNRTRQGRLERSLFFAVITLALLSLPAMALPESQPASTGQDETKAKGRVEVQPVSSDRDIDRRLSRIMTSTGWFEDIQVEVKDGVVFLDGRTASDRRQAWAGDLASRTRDVVAVVNRIQVTEGPVWDLSPAIGVIRSFVQRAVQAAPMIGLSLILLILSVAVAKGVATMMRRLLRERLNPLITDIVSRTLALLTFLVGLYLVLHVAGLARLAATIIGGTGIAGLVAGIAFRDILENFLASMLISIRNPFRLEDVVDIGGRLGVVQRVTSRGTVLMDMDGNHIQIPNATVYKSIIQNFTANPNRRDFFEVGIGYDSDIVEAQKVALSVLEGHPAVLREPETVVLADRLGAATVNLKAYYWYDGTRHNGPKIKSSLIRLVKSAFQNQEISMPDEAREIVFPEGIPVQLTDEKRSEHPREEKASRLKEAGVAAGAIYTEAEGEASSEAAQISKQARQARNPEESPDLLADTEKDPVSEKKKRAG